MTTFIRRRTGSQHSFQCIQDGFLNPHVVNDQTTFLEEVGPINPGSECF
jgi:hypothetical protein